MSSNLSEKEMAFAYWSLSRPKTEEVSSKLSPEELSFAQYSLQPILKTEEEVPWYKSIPAAALKGFVRGTISLGEMFGGLGGAPEEKQEMQAQREEVLKKQLPSKEGFVEEVVERGAELLPSVASGGGRIGGTLVRSGLSALSGKAAKELGAGETGGAIAELPALVGPGFGKKISPSTKQKEFVDEARRLGLSEETIAPLLSGEKKQKFWVNLRQKVKKLKNVWER